MALQVWLPLNGDLTQQGLSGVEVTNNGAVVNNDGKLGKCYQFSNNAIYGDFSGINSMEQMSGSCWVYLTSLSEAQYFFHFGGQGSYPCKFSLDYEGSIRSIINGTEYVSGITLTINTWYHLAVTFDSNIVKWYVNGEEKAFKTVTGTFSASNHFAIGSRTNSSAGTTFAYPLNNGRMNDVRIYDHCLSVKEVKELSKGLVLHYKLDGKEETSSNLITTEDGLSNTAYNSANGKYGYNADSNIAKIIGDFNGKHCTKVYMITEGQAARPYVYISSLFVSNGGSQPEYKAISFDYYGTIGTYINHYKLGNGTGTATWKNTTTGKSGTFTNSGNILVTPNQWNHIEIILHGTTEADAQFGYFPLGDQHTSSANNYWLFANVQVEAKDHVTPYMGPGGSRNYTTEFDCSGYKYNGTIVGTLTSYPDTCKYSASTYFESYNDYIYCNLKNNIPDSITMTCWIKSSNKSPRGGFHNPITIHSTNFELSILGSSGKTRIGYMVGGTRYVKDVGPDILDNQWHMLTGTYDGQKICRYVDGELVDSQSVSGALTTLDIIRVGSINTTYGNTQLYQSDVRVYATALSAEDIIELYHTAASVDNHGNVYAGEIKEV